MQEGHIDVTAELDNLRAEQVAVKRE